MFTSSFVEQMLHVVRAEGLGWRLHKIYPNAPPLPHAHPGRPPHISLYPISILMRGTKALYESNQHVL